MIVGYIENSITINQNMMFRSMIEIRPLQIQQNIFII